VGMWFLCLFFFLALFPPAHGVGVKSRNICEFGIADSDLFRGVGQL